MSEIRKRTVDFTQLGLEQNGLTIANDLLVKIKTPWILRYYLSGINNPQLQIDRRLTNHFERWLYDEIEERPENFTSLRVLATDNAHLNNCEVDWYAWAKPTFPITADFAHIWEQFGSKFIVVGDGAQMILRRDELEDKKIKKASEVVLPEGRRAHAPDHLWSAFAQFFFEGDKLPIAENVRTLFQTYHEHHEQEELNITTAQNVVEGHLATKDHDNCNLLLEKLFKSFNENLNRFYSYVFGEHTANQGPIAQLPSGVMAVGVLTPQNEFYCAWTGDVDIFFIDDNGLAYRKSYETVDIYDYVSRTLIGYDRVDREFMKRVAEKRIFEVGNLNGRSDVKINFDHFSIPVRCGVILSTDGKRMQYVPTDFRSRRKIKSHTDISATLGWRDPHLHQLELMHQQRMWRKAVAQGKVDPHEVYIIPDDVLQLRLRRLE